MPTENLFTGGDLPPGDPDLWAENVDRTFGYTVRFDIAGTVTGVRVYGPENDPPATVRGKFFLKSNESLLEAKTYGGTIATEDWTDIVFDDPVSVSASTDYVVCFYMSGEGNYCHTASVLNSNKVNGHITAVANEGRYKTGSGTDDFPSSTYNGIFFVDVIFEFSGEQIVAVGQASETDSSLAMTHARGAQVGLASETDTALGMTSAKMMPIGLASETDTAFAMTHAKVVNVGIAQETDFALTIMPSQVRLIGQAVETDTALSITPVGVVDDAQKGLTDVWYLNDLAGTITNGVPGLSAVDAAAVWLVLSKTLALPGMVNLSEGKALPNWLALQGILNEMAGTAGLSVTECLYRLANP